MKRISSIFNTSIVQTIIIIILLLIIIFIVCKYMTGKKEQFAPILEKSSILEDNYNRYQLKPFNYLIRAGVSNDCEYCSKRGEHIDLLKDNIVRKEIKNLRYNDFSDELKDEIKQTIKESISENFKVLGSDTIIKPKTTTTGINNETVNLKPEEIQNGYYKIFHDLEEINNDQYVKLNLPVGNNLVETSGTISADILNNKDITKPENYYLQYKTPSFVDFSSIVGSNAANYVENAKVSYENDDLTGKNIQHEEPDSSNE